MTEMINIQGMSCGGCVNSVRRALGKLPLQKAEVEVGRARVEYDEKQVGRTQIVSAIEAAGFKVAGAPPHVAG